MLLAERVARLERLVLDMDMMPKGPRRKKSTDEDFRFTERDRNGEVVARRLHCTGPEADREDKRFTETELERLFAQLPGLRSVQDAVFSHGFGNELVITRSPRRVNVMLGLRTVTTYFSDNGMWTKNNMPVSCKTDDILVEQVRIGLGLEVLKK